MFHGQDVNGFAECVIGVSSFRATSKKDANLPNVFTATDHFARWIEDSISSLEAQHDCFLCVIA